MLRLRNLLKIRCIYGWVMQRVFLVAKGRIFREQVGWFAHESLAKDFKDLVEAFTSLGICDRIGLTTAVALLAIAHCLPNSTTTQVRTGRPSQFLG